MSVDPAECNQIVLIDHLTQLMFLFGAAGVRCAFLFGEYTMGDDEFILSQFAGQDSACFHISARVRVGDLEETPRNVPRNINCSKIVSVFMFFLRFQGPIDGWSRWRHGRVSFLLIFSHQLSQLVLVQRVVSTLQLFIVGLCITGRWFGFFTRINFQPSCCLVLLRLFGKQLFNLAFKP